MSTTVKYKGNTLTTVSNATKTLKTAGKYMEGDVILTDTSAGAATIESLSITPSELAQTFNASGVDGYKPVSVGAISSTYVGSEITRRSSTDLTASGATVTVPSGYYSEQVSKTVALMSIEVASSSSGKLYNSIQATTTMQYINYSEGYNSEARYIRVWAQNGTAGTPTATKGTVSNHSVSVTPSVTNTTGYITGSTKTGTAVTVSASELVSGSETKTENGTYDVTNLAELVVNVPIGPTINNQDKSVTPSESQQSVSADSGYTGLGTVIVEAISSTYVGSGIARKSSTDLTVSGATVTTPAGYYAEAASKSVATMTLPTSAGTSGEGTQKARISRHAGTRYINIPVGYNATSQYYTLEGTPNGSVTAPSSISGTAASVSTGTNTLTLTKTVSVTPNVTTAGYISSGTATNSSVSLTASVTTKAAATITPTTTNQTIAAGTYLTGAQTIAGDADLVASNIVSTANIFGVQGSVVVQNYYTGSSAPSSSLGQNGDIYLQE